MSVAKRVAGETGLALFVEGRRELLAFAERIVGCRALAEDLVQESWLRWQGRAYPEERAPSLLAGIVRNLAYDWLRRRRRERVALDAIAASGEVPDAERVAIAREDVARVADALATLPERTRRAFLLSRIEGLPYAAIGKQLGVSAPRAHQLVHQALLHVAKSLEG